MDGWAFTQLVSESYEDTVSTMQACFTCSVTFHEIIIFMLQDQVGVFASCVSVQCIYCKSIFFSHFYWKRCKIFFKYSSQQSDAIHS